jgi:hypothetical protein
VVLILGHHIIRGIKDSSVSFESLKLVPASSILASKNVWLEGDASGRGAVETGHFGDALDDAKAMMEGRPQRGQE